MKKILLPFFIIFIALAACTLPRQESTPTADNSFIIFTQSAQTVEARLTELAVVNTPEPPVVSTLPIPATETAQPTAPAITPEPTSAPTIQPQPTASLCDVAAFVADVTIPDGTVMDPNKPFTKTWRLKNTGTCAWTTSYAIVFDKGNQMSASAPVPMPKTVNPGETVDISINMVSPLAQGDYIGYWKLRNASNVIFGLQADAKPFYVSIKVGSTAKGTVAYSFVDNYCSATWSSGAGNLPCPGTEGDAEGYILKLDAPKLENGGTENEAGLYTFPQNVNNGYISGKFPAFAVKSGDRFRAVIGCLYNANNCNVQFQLNYTIDGGAEQNFGQWNKKYDGNLQKLDLDLSALAGKNVVFILRVNASGAADQDQAFWLLPRIER